MVCLFSRQIRNVIVANSIKPFDHKMGRNCKIHFLQTASYFVVPLPYFRFQLELKHVINLPQESRKRHRVGLYKTNSIKWKFQMYD